MVSIPDGRIAAYEIGLDPFSHTHHVMLEVGNGPDSEPDRDQARGFWHAPAWCGHVRYTVIAPCWTPLTTDSGLLPEFCPECLAAINEAKRARTVAEGAAPRLSTAGVCDAVADLLGRLERSDSVAGVAPLGSDQTSWRLALHDGSSVVIEITGRECPS